MLRPLEQTIIQIQYLVLWESDVFTAMTSAKGLREDIRRKTDRDSKKKNVALFQTRMWTSHSPWKQTFQLLPQSYSHSPCPRWRKRTWRRASAMVPMPPANHRIRNLPIRNHTHKDSRSHSGQELCDPKHQQMASQTPHKVSVNRAAKAEAWVSTAWLHWNKELSWMAPRGHICKRGIIILVQ